MNRRLLYVTVPAALAAVVALVVLWPSGGGGPEPIVYGRDACDTCRMVITRPGFGGGALHSQSRGIPVWRLAE